MNTKSEKGKENEMLEEIAELCGYNGYMFCCKNAFAIKYKSDFISDLYLLFVKSQIDETNQDINYLYYVGIYYYYFEENYKKAKEYFLLGYDKNHADSICHLGYYYEVIEKNTKKALDLYHYLEEKQHTIAINLLGRYHYSLSKSIDYEIAKLKWLKVLEIENAGEQAIYARFQLAKYYIMKKDWEKAKEYWFEITKMKTYKCLIAKAYHCLGWHYYQQMEDKNISLASQYFVFATELGSREAMNNLGAIHKDVKEYDNAIRYYEMAVQKGNSYAMTNIGNYYYGVKKNYEKAKEYYLQAIQTKNPSINAFYNLGYLYNDIYDNTEISQKYFILAAEKGHKGAINELTMFNRIALNYKLMSESL